jgi:hypothetical protein
MVCLDVVSCGFPHFVSTLIRPQLHPIKFSPGYNVYHSHPTLRSSGTETFTNTFKTQKQLEFIMQQLPWSQS